MKPTRYKSLTALAVLLALPVMALGSADSEIKIGDKPFVYRKTVEHDTLWHISRSVLPAGSNVSQVQVMAAMLRHNPEAFRDGSVFYLHKGVTLNVPSLAQIKAEDAAKAESFYLGQEKSWLEGSSQGPKLYSLSGEAAPVVPAPVQPSAPVEAAKPVAPAPAAKAPEVVPAPVPQAPAPSTPVDAKPQGAPTPAAPVPAAEPRPGLAEAPMATQNDFWGGAWPFLAGAVLLILGLWAMMRRGGAKPVAEVAAKSDVAVSMEGLETTKAVEAMAVSQTMVSPEGGAQSGAAPVEAHEAEIKLKMAKAYLELKRDQAARELLEEVLLEGSPALKQQAQALLA